MSSRGYYKHLQGRSEASILNIEDPIAIVRNLNFALKLASHKA